MLNRLKQFIRSLLGEGRVYGLKVTPLPNGHNEAFPHDLLAKDDCFEPDHFSKYARREIQKAIDEAEDFKTNSHARHAWLEDGGGR